MNDERLSKAIETLTWYSEKGDEAMYFQSAVAAVLLELLKERDV